MKYFFENVDELSDGIMLLADELNLELVSYEDAQVRVTVKKGDKDYFALDWNAPQAVITYGGSKSRFFRALGILVEAVSKGEKSKSVTQKPDFTVNGAMIDMSRNAVMKVETVKYMMRKMALLGMDMFMLYTEDTYEVKTRPYFGHMRGRYSKEEIQEMDAYAISLGIELVPCIQCLGHLETMLRWHVTAPYKDTANVLLAGAEETYQLIEELLTTVSECFTSRRLHMGMDEAFDLGTGVYLRKNGYRDHWQIFLEHLKKVSEMAVAHGFEPMIWSDMFFRMAGKDISDYSDYDIRVNLPEDIGEQVPKGVRTVFWDYYHPEQAFYDINLKKHELFGGETIFAGGVWAWSTYSILYKNTIRNSVPALKACKENGVKEVIAAVWHNGSVASLVMSLAGLAMYAEISYLGCYDEKKVSESLERCCGVPLADFLAVEEIEYPDREEMTQGSSKLLLYNDPLIGLLDRHVAMLETGDYYRKLTKQIEHIGKGNSMIEPGFDVLKKLCSLLENKADFGVRLKKAYDAEDKDTLKALLQECDVILSKLNELRSTHRNSWMLYNKSFGWEVHDIRYGGLMMRFDTVKSNLKAYLAGEINQIDTLEEKRLWFNLHTEGMSPMQGLWRYYDGMATPGIL